MHGPARVLFIGIDAAESSLIRAWSEAGALPTLAALARSSLCGATTNAPGIYTGSVWPSFHTGVGPGRHGRYFYRQLEPGTYKTARFTSERLPVEPFWGALERAGRRVAVVDLPKAPLVRSRLGLQLADWGLHDPDGPPRSSPRALAGEIIARFGADPVGPCDLAVHDGAMDVFRDTLIERVRRKTRIALHLLERGSWDLFATAYGDSHCAGHQLWALHDRLHPRHDASVARALGGDPLRDVYAAIDAGIGEILATAGADSTVVVLASHGMGAHYDGTFLLDDILRRLEGLPAASGSDGALGSLRQLWHKMPARVRSKLMPLSDRFYDTWVGRDRGARKCFLVPTNDNCAGICVNVAGREPRGIVKPGAELEAFCDALAADLADIVNVESGEPIVREVIRSAEIFPGEHADALPDLLVQWHRDAPIRAVRSAKIGTIEREYRGLRTGDHRNPGMFFARGAGIVPGRRTHAVAVTNFAPTLAALLGVELSGVDGTPIGEICGAARPDGGRPGTRGKQGARGETTESA